MRKILLTAAILFSTLLYAQTDYGVRYRVIEESEDNIITNGTFNSDLSGWTTTGSSWVWESDGSGGGYARHNTGNTDYLIQSDILEDGATYEVTYTITGITQGAVRARCGELGTGTIFDADGTYTEEITQDGGDLDFKFTENSDFDGAVDDVIVTKISE